MKIAGLVVTVVLASVGSAVALGQPAGGYPPRLVRIVVPVAPGGTVDIITRTLAQRLTESLGQQVIVENRPSASSLVGTQWVAKSAPDGYTLLATSTTFLSAPAIVPQPGYEDFTINGLLAPTGTPREILARLHGEVAKIAGFPELHKRFLDQGIELAASSSPDEFTAYIKSEVARYAKLA